MLLTKAEYAHAVSGLQTTGSFENKWHGVWWEPSGLQRGGESKLLVWSVESEATDMLSTKLSIILQSRLRQHSKATRKAWPPGHKWTWRQTSLFFLCQLLADKSQFPLWDRLTVAWGTISFNHFLWGPKFPGGQGRRQLVSELLGDLENPKPLWWPCSAGWDAGDPQEDLRHHHLLLPPAPRCLHAARRACSPGGGSSALPAPLATKPRQRRDRVNRKFTNT